MKSIYRDNCQGKKIHLCILMTIALTVSIPSRNRADDLSMNGRQSVHTKQEVLHSNQITLFNPDITFNYCEISLELTILYRDTADTRPDSVREMQRTLKWWAYGGFDGNTFTGTLDPFKHGQSETGSITASINENNPMLTSFSAQRSLFLSPAGGASHPNPKDGICEIMSSNIIINY